MTELCVYARVHLGPRGDARRNRPPMGGVGKRPPGPEGLSSQRKPPGRVEPSWGSRNQSRPSRLCPPPRQGPHGGLDGDLPQARSARTRPGSLLWMAWWAPAQGRTGLPSAWRPGLTITAKSHRRPRRVWAHSPAHSAQAPLAVCPDPANRSVITAALCPPLPPSSLGPGPTLPARRAAACWAGWVGHLGT